MRLLAFTLVLAAAVPAVAQPTTHRFQTRTMGTVAAVQIVASDSTQATVLVGGAFEAFARVDSLMSNWTTTSEVARLNRLAGQTLTVHPEVADVLEAALQIGMASDGAFDITVEPLVRLWGFLGGTPRVPAGAEIDAVLSRVGWNRLAFESPQLRVSSSDVRIDLGGIAKGYAVDEAARALREAGVESALIDLSGNMMPMGSPPGRAYWTVGVRDPFDRAPYFARLRLAAGQAIATSGDYEQFVAADGRRYGHILDPRTGWPTHELVAVTVLAPTALEADAWATAFFVLGTERSRQLASERDDLQVILVQAAREGTHEVWVEESLGARFTLESETMPTFSVRWF